MYNYTFTNDLRIATLKDSLINAAKCISTNSIPSAAEEKSQNNNINTLGFYFNLTENSNCTKLAAKGFIEPVVLNFIKKFQFPNLRTKESFNACKEDGIILAPMRMIIKILYLMNILCDDKSSYLTRDEIKNFIFYNEELAKKENSDLHTLIVDLLKYRNNKKLPSYINIIDSEHSWKHEDRQLREMTRILIWSKCVEEQGETIRISKNNLTQESKAMIYDIVNYNKYWGGSTLDDYREYMDIASIEINNDIKLKIQENKVIETGGFNKIYYGIPGCGKSYKISAMLSFEDAFKEEAMCNGISAPVNEENIVRTTFYLDYSNSDFLGQIYPVVEGDKVKYEPIPGPFTKALEKAYTNRHTMVYLVIEEINRGNAAAIFGDTFQLLDRLKENKDGRLKGDSEYPISNEFLERYFTKINMERVSRNEEELPFEKGQIIIPSNLTIFATMNTSDQNVFPLDTAFKRRWDRERVVTDWNKVDFKDMYIPFTDYSWLDFATNVNIKMVSENDDGVILEDKQLGPYFINSDMLVLKEERMIDNDENRKKLKEFVNNVMEYIYSDVSKFNHDLFFKDDIRCYENIYDSIIEYDESGNYVGDKNLCLKDISANIELLGQSESNNEIENN